jgi:phytoene dehydrogenase-like protein
MEKRWLTGSSPSDSFNQIWKELGAVQGRKIYDHDEFYRFTGTDGRTLIFYNDADRLEKHLKEISPADYLTIELLCSMIRKFSEFRMPQNKAAELYNIFDFVRIMVQMGPYMKIFKFCGSVTMSEFANRFSDPLIKEVFPFILGDKEMSLIAFVATMALLHKKGGGFPEGGSLEFARAIESRFLNLGGKITYGAKVGVILVREGAACGVLLEKGGEVQADYVISAADLHSTIYKMLNGLYLEPQHQELFRKAKIFSSSLQVSFGINMDLSSEPDCIAQVFKLKVPLIIGNQKSEWLMIRNYSFDPTLAPKGKSVVECMFMIDDFEYWEALYNNKNAYDEEKSGIAKAVSKELNKIYPGFSDAIEVTDVLTPMTYVRYTGNYRGAYMTWVMTPYLMKHHRVVKKTLPGLKNFWLSGMWVQPPGGVPTGAKTSRDIIQIICHKDKRKFIVNEL